MRNVTYSHVGTFDMVENKMIIIMQSIDYYNKNALP